MKDDADGKGLHGGPDRYGSGSKNDKHKKNKKLKGRGASKSPSNEIELNAIQQCIDPASKKRTSLDKLAALERRNVRYFDTRRLRGNRSIQFLDLYTFKVFPCKLDPATHNMKQCPFYHDLNKDRRRPLGTYSSEMCPFLTGK